MAIGKRKVGRPKGSKDKSAKKVRKISKGRGELQKREDVGYDIQKEIRKTRFLREDMPNNHLLRTLADNFKQSMSDLQRQLLQRKSKDKVDDILDRVVVESIPVEISKIPQKPRGRPRKNIEALLHVIDESLESEVEDVANPALEPSETIINKRKDNRLKNGNKPGKGRPKGSKNRITVALEKIGDDNAVHVYQKIVELALSGDINACKVIMDRVYPLRKGRKFTVELDRSVETINDINEFSKKILNMMAEGEISAEEAMEYGRVFEQGMKIMTDTEVVKKIENTCQKVEDIKNGR